MPPAILKEYKKILRWFKMKLPKNMKKISIRKAYNTDSAATLVLLCLIFGKIDKKTATVPNGSIARKYRKKDSVKGFSVSIECKI